jgi:glycosyltransferase involved in cell wall biosynthesis
VFTIIVPTHDRPLLLHRALASLAAQTYRDFTVVVVDDAGEHIPPYQILTQLKGRFVYVIRSGRPGPAESRDMGVALAKSKYVMFLDDDDTMEPGHLQALADHIGAQSPDILFCDFKVQREDRATNPPTPLSLDELRIDGVTYESVFVRNRIPNCCAVYRREILKGKRHDAGLRIYEDWDFLLACLKGRKLRHVPTSTVVVHKTPKEGDGNLRRGNTRDDLLVEVTLELYRRHRAPDKKTRQARYDFLTAAGVPVTMDQC